MPFHMTEDEYCNEDGETVEAAGYNAEYLVEKEGFIPVAAYRFLAELKENRDKIKKG